MVYDKGVTPERGLVLLGCFFFLGLATAGLAQDGLPASGERETVGRVISEWDSDCDGGQRDAWDDMVRAWYNAITDSSAEPDGHGSEAWVKDGFYHNGNIVDSDFVDPNERSWGKDDQSDRLDEVDVCMVGLHGGNSSDNHRWLGRVRVDESGDGNCNAWQGDMVFGDTDSEFLHLSSCYSMDKEDWWSEWNPSFDRLHQIGGFHGIMWIGTSLVSDYEDFADDCFEINIADAWIDNMYHKDINNSYDQCPIPRGVGDDEDDLWERMDNEQYNDVYSHENDPPGAGSSRTHGVYYIKGCDPKGKDALD